MGKVRDISIMKINRYSFFFIVIFISNSLYCLGAFNMFNGRNRAELNWYEVETEYSKIIYSDNLDKTALEAAAIADSTFLTLSKSFGVFPQNKKGNTEKVIIYISDQDNISNGACVLNEYIFIWVNQNDYLKMFTGNHKWLRKVISHEMVHWFLAYSIRDWISPFLPMSMISFPTNINEGFAQHFSGEEWGFNRGDRYLRTWTFATTNNYNGRWLGGFMYGNGFAFIKYLSEFYGEDKLFELLKYRNKIGLYDFNSAFNDVYKKSLNEMQREWTRYIKTWYYGEAYLKKVISDDVMTKTNSLNDITPLKSSMIINDLVMKTDNIVLDVKLTKNQNYSSLISGKLVIDSLKADKFIVKDINYIEEAPAYNSLDISSQGDYITYSRYTRHKYGRLAPRVYLYDILDDKKYDLNEGNHPVVTNEGEVFYQKLSLDENCVYKTNIIEQSIKTDKFISFLPENQIGEMRLNSDDSILAISIFDSDRNFLVSLFDTNTAEVIDVLKFENMPQQIIWQDIDKLAVSVENSNTFVLDLYVYNTVDKSIKKYDGPPLNVYPVLITETENNLNTIAMTELERDMKVLGKVSFVEKNVEKEFNTPNNYYSRWINRTAKYQIPETIKAYESLDIKEYNSFKNIKFRQGFAYPTDTGVLGSVVLSEALGKHLMMSMFYLPYNNKTQAIYYLNYLNNVFKPAINLYSFKSKWVAGISDNEVYYNIITQVGLNFNMPIDFHQIPFLSISYGGGINYNKFELTNDSKEYAYLFDDDEIIIANTNIDLHYNLPWKNDLYHPVKALKTSFSFDYSSENYGMKRDYWQLRLYNDISISPLREVFSSEFFKTIIVQNRTTYREVGDNPLVQFMPGVDDSEFIQVNGQPAFSRLYLRGYEETLWGSRLFSMQSDLKFKIFDSLPISFNIGFPVLSAGYFGISTWVDYTKLFQPEMLTDNPKALVYKAVGFEIKSAWNVLDVPTLHKYGYAWDTKHNKLGYYYMMEIPFMLF